MRWTTARLLAALLLLAAGWLGGAAAAQPSATAQLVQLRDSMREVEAHSLARVWVDAGGNAGIADVLRAADGGAFHPARPDATYRLGDDGALWLHLRLQRAPGERQEWLLRFPMPLLDLVTVYQQDEGQWRSESAGDTLAVDRWPEPGRYPLFRLELPLGQARDVFVRIHHVRGADFPVRLTTSGWHADQVQLEYLGLGGAFGAMLLLIIACCAWAWAYRDAVFGWYALYAALTSLAVASFTGTAAHLLWPAFGALQDAPTPMLACAAVAAALLFARNTLGLRRRFPRQDRLVWGLGVAGGLLAFLPALTPKAVHLTLVGGYITLASLVVVAVAAAAWWRGDNVGRWVFFAQTPMGIGAVVAVFRVLGWVALPFATQYMVVLGLAIEVPLLLVALFIRSRDRHSAEIREQALSTQDALTGLLAPHLFTDRLRQVVARHRRDGEHAAVMYIDLVNHGRIHQYFGNTVADQSLLRAVIKLRRLLRDVDTVSRVGEARFGVILEGASSRASVTERATRLIAAGLMPLPGLKPEVTLQFHVAAVLLHELCLDAEDLQLTLSEQLARMSPRTRRPIRFLAQRQLPQAADDSLLFATEAEAPDAAAGLATAPAP